MSQVKLPLFNRYLHTESLSFKVEKYQLYNISFCKSGNQNRHFQAALFMSNSKWFFFGLCPSSMRRSSHRAHEVGPSILRRQAGAASSRRNALSGQTTVAPTLMPDASSQATMPRIRIRILGFQKGRKTDNSETDSPIDNGKISTGSS